MSKFVWFMLFLFPLSSQLGIAATPVFQVEDLHQIVKDSVQQKADSQWTMQEQLDFIHTKLTERYGKKINQNPKWMFNQTAGALGQLQILYCSPSEYVIVFGSSIGTEGHTGRYEMDVWDMMIEGEMWTAKQGDLERISYKPGDIANLPSGTSKAFKIPEYGYMLEYSHGNIIAALKQGVILPALFLNQDYESMKLQLQECGKLAIASLFNKK